MSALPVIFLMGPTATGKSALAIALCRMYRVEIISVDSGMVYRGMDIGTAKPSQALRTEFPHHLVDVCNSNESYSAGRFCKDASLAIAQIRQSGNIPLLVGGTGLYFRALTHGLASMPTGNDAIRHGLRTEAKALGWPALHAQLCEVDPGSASRIHPNDAQRIERALEVYRLTGRPLRDWQQCRARNGPVTNPIKLMLYPTDKTNHRLRIQQRFQEMLRQGLLQEVEWLMKSSNMDDSCSAMRLVGYRQVWCHLAGQYDHQEMVERAIAATSQLAKRQMTWFRAETELVRLAAEDSCARQAAAFRGLLTARGYHP